MHVNARKSRSLAWIVFALVFVLPSAAQTCLTANDMGESSRSALVNTAQRYFTMVTQGDVASLRQNSIPGLAGSFTGVEAAVTEHKTNLLSTQPSARPPFLLQAQGPGPIERAEFLCGVFGKSGQTPGSAVFVIPNLPPGDYAVAILDAATSKGPFTVTFVLQQQAAAWQMAGFYVKAAQVSGHDGKWFVDRAHEFKTKGQMHNAWLYFLQARDLLVPVPFMSTMASDQLYDEMQTGAPADLPSPPYLLEIVGKAEEPAASPQPSMKPTDQFTGTKAKTFSVTQMFPLAVGNDLDLIVKYQAPDISNTGQVFQDNLSLIRALVAKYPELREAFTGVVARAVDPSGRDFGSMLAMKDIK